MDNGRICYQTKTIYEVQPEWKIRLKVISDAFDMSFGSKKEFKDYVDKQTKIIMQNEEETLKRKTKDFYKKGKNLVDKIKK